MRISDWSSDVCSSDLVEGVERALEEAGGDGRAHVDAGVEQLGRKGGRLLGHLVEARPQPIEAAVDGDRFITRKTAHVAAPPLRPRGRPGDAPAGRPSPVDRMLHITALPADYLVEQFVHIHRPTPSESRNDNQIDRKSTRLNSSH